MRAAGKQSFPERKNDKESLHALPWNQMFYYFFIGRTVKKKIDFRYLLYLLQKDSPTVVGCTFNFSNFNILLLHINPLYHNSKHTSVVLIKCIGHDWNWRFIKFGDFGRNIDTMSYIYCCIYNNHALFVKLDSHFLSNFFCLFFFFG